MIIVKNLFRDDKKLISYYFYRRSAPYGKKTALLKKIKINKNKKIKKKSKKFNFSFFDVKSSVPGIKLSLLIVGAKMSSSSRKSHKDVWRQVGRFMMSRTMKHASLLILLVKKILKKLAQLDTWTEN